MNFFARQSLISLVFLSSLLFACGSPDRGGRRKEALLQEVDASGSEVFGRYIGYIYHPTSGLSQLTRLEFIPQRDVDNKLKLSALLTIYFGDFMSDEYLTYHFDNVPFNAITGLMQFRSPEQGISFQVEGFGGEEFESLVTFSSSSMQSRLILSRKSQLERREDIIAPLSGQYFGHCENNKPEVLQIFTGRSANDTHRSSNPFSSFEVKGQLGSPNATLCPAMEGSRHLPLCADGVYTSGSFNFLEGKLKLAGQHRTLECVVGKDSIECGECSFQALKRTSLVLEPPEAVEYKFSSESTSDFNSDSGSGTYSGYVFHERLNKYQLASVEISFNQNSEGSAELSIGGSAHLYFGDKITEQSLDYVFSPTHFPLLAAQKNFVLQRPDADIDAILKVNDFRNDEITGVWYSRIFGRVGPFIVKKKGISSEGREFIQFIEGRFGNPEATLTLGTRRAELPFNTENPLSGYAFTGGFWYNSGISRSIPISGGSFDFFTGKMMLELGDDSERVLVGKKLESGDIEFYRTTRRYGFVIQESPEIFKPIKE